MVVAALAKPIILGYLYQTFHHPRGSKGIPVLFALLGIGFITAGSIFGMVAIYDYFSEIYSPMVTKGYMSIVCGASAVVIMVVWKIWNNRINRQRQSYGNIRSLEEYFHTLETDGLNIIKQHPLATTLIGMSLGVLTGIASTVKQK
jgi:hypothetical protein